MIVHLAGSASHLEEDARFLGTIADTIHKNGDMLALNWFDPAHGKNVDNTPQKNWASILDEYVASFRKADVIIIEGTRYRFGIGFFAALAAQDRKPTLFVTRGKIKDLSISGIQSQYLARHEYRTHRQLSTIVEDFLAENALDAQDQRFNFFIDRPIYNYLRSKAFETGKSKSEIIRELLDREINRGRR